MGHFAITGEQLAQTIVHERFARSAAGLSGAHVDPFTVWLDDWRLQGDVDEQGNFTTLTIATSEGGDSLSLNLQPVKPLTLQGENGYSRKGSDRCNSSFYYSIPRLTVTGELAVQGNSYPVTGLAWFDREWSSSALSDNLAGWDWFALHFDDGKDFMYYQLRKVDGSRGEHSYAVQIDEQGRRLVVDISDVAHQVDQWWTGPAGNRYPVAGEFHRRDTGERFRYRPLIENQELPLTVRYWEGAIILEDLTGKAIGRGYLELTGY